MSSQSSPIPGGWSEFTCAISAEAKQAFAEATRDLVGVRYSPFAVSQQVVAGMNYKFLCNGTPATLHPVSGLYALHVFKPPTTDHTPHPAKVTAIVPLYP